MAQKAVHLDRETLSCSICLELLKDPVTIPCGHSYCLSCIKKHWDREDGKGWDEEDEEGIHSCPQCRKRFRSRPELLKNTMLADVVEQLKETEAQGAPADHCYAGAEDVACDVCTGSKLKALKSYLVCLASYCHTHLQPHRDAAPLKRHQLVEPSKNLQENVCSRHNEGMKIFCRTDKQCICYLCSLDEHVGHDTVSAAAERREKQEKLQETRQILQQRIQDRERDMKAHVKVVQQELKNIDLSADKAVEHSRKIYTDLILLIEKRRSDMEQKIRSQQEAEVRRVKELQEKLEQEVAELRSKDAELQQLSNTEDHCSFLRDYPSVSQLPGSTHSSRIHIRPRRYFEDVTAAVSESSQKIGELLRDTQINLSLTPVDDLRSEPKTRAEFLRYSRDITLDPNTANTHLLLSEGNRRATWRKNYQSHPYHPDRFTDHCQVLSKESLTGRCYWEVKIRKGRVKVAVASENICRAGDGSRFGHNDKSWASDCSNVNYIFMSNSVSVTVSGPWSSTVGVYLDHPAGVLSFYSVSDTMTLLRRFKTSFTQPLHAGLWLYHDSSADLVKP